MPRRPRTQKRRRPCEATFHALNKWYEMMFEKLGWMVLAKNKGYNDKLTEYLMSLNRLKECLNNKIRTIRETDRFDDLRIMCENVDILIAHARKDFG